jgi:hypothetical protein
MLGRCMQCVAWPGGAVAPSSATGLVTLGVFPVLQIALHRRKQACEAGAACAWWMQAVLIFVQYRVKFAGGSGSMHVD